MTKQFLAVVLFACFISLTVISCKKGDTGPAGQNGSNGTNGTNGNANVKMDSFDVGSTDWVYGTVYWIATSPSVSQGQFAKYFVHNDANITDSIINYGAVLAYFKAPGTVQSDWTLMPYSWIENISGKYTFNYDYLAESGKLTSAFYFASIAGNAPPTISTYTVPPIRVKVICVAASKIGLNDVQRLKMMSYDEAKAALQFD